MTVRWPWMAIVWALVVSACGFHLQGKQPLPKVLASTWIETRNDQTEFVHALRAGLASAGSVAASRTDATAVVDISVDELRERVVSVSADNLPREYELTYLVRFAVSSGGVVVLEPREVSVAREFSYDERIALAKEREREQLSDALAREAASRVLRQLASLQ
ncbi:MAG: LPS assembly lipoprotein LptE [Steroidobacteraceae bacterium]